MQCISTAGCCLTLKQVYNKIRSFFLIRSSLILSTRSPRSLGWIPQKWMCNYEKATKATADPTHQDGTGIEGSISSVCQPRLELQQRVNGFIGTCWPPDGLADGLKFVFSLPPHDRAESEHRWQLTQRWRAASRRICDGGAHWRRTSRHKCMHTHAFTKCFAHIHTSRLLIFPTRLSEWDCKSHPSNSGSIGVCHWSAQAFVLRVFAGMCSSRGEKKGNYLPVREVTLTNTCRWVESCVPLWQNANLNQCSLLMNIPASYTSEQFLTDPVPLMSLLLCAFFSNSPPWSLMGWMAGATVLSE